MLIAVCICVLNIYYCYDVIIDWIINYSISAVLEIGIEGFITFIGSRIFIKYKQRINETFDKSLDKSIDKILDFNKGEKSSVILNTNLSRLDYFKKVTDLNECDYEIIADYKQGEFIKAGRIGIIPNNKIYPKETKTKQIAEESKVNKGDSDSNCDFDYDYERIAN
ncbi:hypothetical protein SteCoe_40233 [Stentor coeruleus]|uniref:Uncharacterized protein n=1 Tax=Stentor coeruleus TaxID=5963 RepID=A0A1R2AKD1_9CILI|nr:hypothetical protein SteCoe_40233 [Stentor coeruleus]